MYSNRIDERVKACVCVCVGVCNHLSCHFIIAYHAFTAARHIYLLMAPRHLSIKSNSNWKLNSSERNRNEIIQLQLTAKAENSAKMYCNFKHTRRGNHVHVRACTTTELHPIQLILISILIRFRPGLSPFLCSNQLKCNRSGVCCFLLLSLNRNNCN